MKIQIRERYDNAKVLFEMEAESVKQVVEKAVARGANLGGADLRDVKADFLAEVLKLPNELDFLRSAILEGKIDGSTYSGECACLAGTLAHAKGITDYRGGNIANGCVFRADLNSPRERFFLAIREGHTPENNSASKIALEWTDEAIAIRDNIRNSITVCQKPSGK